MRRGQILRRGGFEPPLRLGEVPRDGHAPHVHVPEVELRELVPLVRRRLKLPKRRRLVAIHSPPEQPAVPHVPLRLGNAPRRHVLLHQYLLVAVLHLLRAHPPGVPLAITQPPGLPG